MSPQLKPLLLPQLVEEQRRKTDEAVDLSHVYYTTNSSSSDVASPLIPTFSPRGHQRFPSSSSSLELPPPPPQQDSPTQYVPAKTEKRQLPDVQEDPMELYEDDYEDDDSPSEQFGLYSCLCDADCQHRNSSDGYFVDDMTPDFDIDYDMGFLSDGDCSPDRHQSSKKKLGDGSPFAGLTSRLGSHLPTIRRWRSSRRANLRASSTADLSLENVLSCEPSSRSSSISASNQQSPDRSQDASTAPCTTSTSSISFYGSTEDLSKSSVVEMSLEEQSSLERDRSMATTPLLPPLLTDPLGKPPQESPLQSPTVAPVSVAASLPTTPQPPPPPYSRPSLSSRPSTTSLRQVPTAAELPLPLPAILQEHDEWSDRLGHANFTITPLPYELDTLSAETVGKFRRDWDTARINYTKHLVRTGEHYGQTSKIYALTEAKWAETERRWKTVYGDIVRQSSRSAPGSASHSRSHSRGRVRGRSSTYVGVASRMHSHDDSLYDSQWRRVEDCLPSVVPRMLESLDAQGKFPCRGDEDIVGPMQRDAVMVRARSEDAKGRFWRCLADKVGFRK